MRLPAMITVLSRRVVQETTSITDTCVIAIGGCLRPEHAETVSSEAAATVRADRRALLARVQSEARWIPRPAARQIPLEKLSASRLLFTQGGVMAVQLHRSALSHARNLIKLAKAVRDERDWWSEHQLSAAKENEFIRRHGWREYGKWHLAVDTLGDEETKGRYKFPYGDFSKVHRCAVISAASRAGQYKYLDVGGRRRSCCGFLTPSDSVGRRRGGSSRKGGNAPQRADKTRTPLKRDVRNVSLKERATGLEPATSSLGSWHSTN